MGRVKTKKIRNITLDILSKYRELFTEDFEKNKEILNDILDTKSKKVRNVVAGYITRLIKNKKLML